MNAVSERGKIPHNRVIVLTTQEKSRRRWPKAFSDPRQTAVAGPLHRFVETMP
jgi:hypothetical protein